jgi:GDP-L-fucose synthase
MILVTGGTSTIGKHLKEFHPDAKYISSSMFDLTRQDEVEKMFKYVKPTIVIHLAATVGGIQDNINYPDRYLEENVLMNTLVTRQAAKTGVKKFIGILSTCIYPDKLSDNQYPMTEDMLHLGPPTPTNFGYGYSKRLLGVQIDTYKRKYNLQYSYITPCNLYSEHDNFHNDGKAHFVTALLQKIKTAVDTNSTELNLFGTGNPLRQFIHSRDVARVINRCITSDLYENFNIADSECLSIKELAESALRALDINLDLKFDISKPDGQYRKDVSNKKLLEYFPDFEFTSFDDGIRLVYESLCNNSDKKQFNKSQG